MLTSEALLLLAPASLPPATSKTHSTSKPCCQRSTGGDVRPLVGTFSKGDTALLPSYFSGVQWCLFWFNICRTPPKLQALVYDILPSTTAVFSYATGSRKLSANEQFFVGAQTVGSLLQTTQIISDVCFIIDHVASASSNKTKIVSIDTELFSFLYPGVDAPHVYVRAWALGCFYSHISTRTFGGPRPRRWTAARRQRVPLQWRNQIW